MRFVHSLVKIKKDNQTGWYAPIELGENTPHYINFVIPVGLRMDDRYLCDLVSTAHDKREVVTQELVREGKDTFLLSVEDVKVWFVIRPVPKNERRLPYHGKLIHPDFYFSFAEIEPEEPADLDRLFMEQGVGILGCDPVTRYSAEGKVAVRRSKLSEGA